MRISLLYPHHQTPQEEYTLPIQIPLLKGIRRTVKHPHNPQSKEVHSKFSRPSPLRAFFPFSGANTPPSPRNILFLSLSLFVSGSFAFLLFQTVSAQFTPPCDTPPNCQPSTGSVTATLLDVLTNGGRAAEFGKLNPDADPTQTGFVGIGGGKRSDLTPAGEVRFGVGTTTPGFPLDVIAQTSGNPDNDTANLRLSYNTASPVWTGVKIDRKAGDEKWFVGMASSSDNLIIRSGANANIVEIPPGKGAACFGEYFGHFHKIKLMETRADILGQMAGVRPIIMCAPLKKCIARQYVNLQIFQRQLILTAGHGLMGGLLPHPQSLTAMDGPIILNLRREPFGYLMGAL